MRRLEGLLGVLDVHELNEGEVLPRRDLHAPELPEGLKVLPEMRIVGGDDVEVGHEERPVGLEARVPDLLAPAGVAVALGPGDVEAPLPHPERLIVQGGDRAFRLLRVGHEHEREAPLHVHAGHLAGGGRGAGAAGQRPPRRGEKAGEEEGLPALTWPISSNSGWSCSRLASYSKLPT